ncbi:MAG: hypothetical protein K0S48_15 [Ramlibacter sp.]|jgi:hypothetical protein|nr:hypothetical protein [Ramlibacter sp.]
MHQLPCSTITGARRLIASGWRPDDEPGRVSPPPGDQQSACQWVSDWTWQAMAMMALEVRGEVCAGTRRPIAPTFGPGTGWYPSAAAAPGSVQDRRELRAAALPATVVVLRRRGERIPAAQLLRTEPPSGLLVCMDRYTAPAWYGCLFDDKMERELLPRLMHLQLERESGGVRLYAGIEVGDRGDPDRRQAWLCTPTPARMREILLAMAEQEGMAG